MAVRTELSVGARLASYTVESVLGRGGTSVVYAAADSRLGRLVALKVLAPPAGESERFRERFLRESRLAASIDHANVIPVYEAGEADGVLYIAMRLVRGSDLRSVLATEGRLDPERTLAIVGQAATALDAAHARGLLHRDVKPGNILLTSGDDTAEHVYLSDFGLAVPGAESGLGEGGFQGTLDYAAPEQINGEPEARSDVYSLACVLFECLTGEPPFGWRRPLETLWCHLNDEPPGLSDRRPDCSAADAVFARALAKDPAERPATCGELIANVRAALGLDRPRRPLRGRVAPAVAAATLVAAVAALVLAVRGNDDAGAVGASTEPTISTFAGSGRAGSAGDGGRATAAELHHPASVAVDRSGNVYVAESQGYRVRRIGRGGVIATVAGTGRSGYSGDGGPATEAEIGWVELGVDPAGTLYILDSQFYPSLRRVARDGTITTVAGTGRAGPLRDPPQTSSPDLCAQPRGPAFDRAGKIYIACPSAHRVLRVEPDGTFIVIAGSGTAGYSGDGGSATAASLHSPSGVAVDPDGNVYVADTKNHRIRRIDPDGVITTVAGTGRPGLSGDGWRATSVDLWHPVGIDVDAAGNVYVAEAATYRVRKFGRDGRITTVAGTGRPGFDGDAGAATKATLQAPTDIAVDVQGNVYIADPNNNRVRRVSP